MKPQNRMEEMAVLDALTILFKLHFLNPAEWPGETSGNHTLDGQNIQNASTETTSWHSVLQISFMSYQFVL